MIKLLGLGDNVCDVYLNTQTMYPGGQALNVAVYAGQLGAQADFMGVFGRDRVAEHVQNTLRDKGIGFAHCRSYDGENGFALVTLEKGDRVFKGSNRGGVIQEHPIFLDREDLEYVADFQLIHTSNNGFTDDLLPALHRTPALLSYDFSYRWREEERLERVCPYLDFAFLSCGELSAEETQSLCGRLHDKGCEVVTATRGGEGAIVFDGRRFYHQKPDLVPALDTMGAGDSFAAAMLVGILKRLEGMESSAWDCQEVRAEILPPALREAAAFAARTCLVHGAFGCGAPAPKNLTDRAL